MSVTTPSPRPADASGRRRRARWIAAAAGVVVTAGLGFLAFGVFGVQALVIDETVDEEGFEFASGATVPGERLATGASPEDAPSRPPPDPAPEAGTDATAPAAPRDDPAAATSPETPPEPEVRLVATGQFVAEGHPGEGTANLYSDGTQSAVRFESDFATDNGPDLKVVVEVDGDRIEVAPLKGNQGAQNYELPADIDPTTVTSVGVWCKRFDYVFTTAPLA